MSRTETTFPELGVFQVLRGRRRGGRSQFDVCDGSGRTANTRGGLPSVCTACQRVLRVTCHGRLPMHMRTVQTARGSR